MTEHGWDPAQYLKFGGERLRPAADLLANVPSASPATIHDLGCGTGSVTRLLRVRWPAARIIGVDSSPDMLARAAAEGPAAEWVQADLARWSPGEPTDLIFSNAALHWLPRHEEFFPGLMDWLAPGGVLAVQMPCNFAAPSHQLIAQVAGQQKWRNRLEALVRPSPVHEPERYVDWLLPMCDFLSVWQTEYLHLLSGEDPVKEWLKGSWLKPFLDALEPREREPFEAECAARLRAAYPARADGITVFRFRRLFIVARRTTRAPGVTRR